MTVSEKLYCITIYEFNGAYVVRKCCDLGWTFHGLGANKLPQCNCEIVARGLTKEDALTIGTNLSKELQVSLMVD
ncbi:hypothetical protein [Sporosarcina sp. FSL K6-3457]|uniref:hypothetical protein n=1 Tax=Sporosarcina sp. FSL K6-3457 TaxID=2978204 RepID=UPI0030F83B32